MSKAGSIKKPRSFMARPVISESLPFERLLCPTKKSDLNHISNKGPEWLFAKRKENTSIFFSVKD